MVGWFGALCKSASTGWPNSFLGRNGSVIYEWLLFGSEVLLIASICALACDMVCLGVLDIPYDTFVALSHSDDFTTRIVTSFILQWPGMLFASSMSVQILRSDSFRKKLSDDPVEEC